MAAIKVQVEGPVALLTLNRPEHLNALTPDMEEEMHERLDETAGDPKVRCLVLTGAGRAFCVGEDIQADASGGERRADPGSRQIGDYLDQWLTEDLRTTERLLHFWRLRLPVIAAVNGYALGKGFWYQLACDVSIAAEGAVFGQPEVRHTSSTSFLFTHLVGWKNASRYTLTGDLFDAAEALRLGVASAVTRDDDLLEDALALAHRIARVPVHSVRLNKAAAVFGLQASGVSAGLVVNSTFSALAHASHSSEREALFRLQYAEGLRAFLDARDGPFRPERVQPNPNWKSAGE